MTTQTLYHAALVAHIAGLTIMAGTTLADYVVTKQFWKQYAIDKTKGIAINEATSKLVVLFGIGIILLILSGVGMMALTHGVFGEQTWFRIKFGLVIIIIINGLAVGRTQGAKLRRILHGGPAGNNTDEGLLKIKTNINWFQLSQMGLFIIVFVLSVFKFN
jgi:hypothetical protein